ncbi:unnamed protein product [Kluyveromyces dobzhanskii CBS 2104]|uniref:WGS project CCBQ000000000 data, contig 00172 n=1 Tax=Kluyveromyces dobzhanskii CBS 2104 TaxID=1427455 RepID=A0A0A8L1D3_9SACH|nr:unnamed protein product [Kluyveromyces dobzhanskii CBS 2104]
MRICNELGSDTSLAWLFDTVEIKGSQAEEIETKYNNINSSYNYNDEYDHGNFKITVRIMSTELPNTEERLTERLDENIREAIPASFRFPPFNGALSKYFTVPQQTLTPTRTKRTDNAGSATGQDDSIRN